MLNNGEIPDVLLSETMMQGMTGRGLSDKLKENPAWQHISMLFLTVWKDKFEADSDFSGDSHIEKPFDMVDLKTRIDTVLKKDWAEVTFFVL